MASIIEGYNYDIFISYRQKDNKGDRWVSEFVEALKTELESTFKEEISVYFDINPHDGLMETHDVDESLKEKLKCLILIPIISRTYCDPKSFAWEHEFKVFVEQASKDQFGLKVKLPNQNVASRVLPIRIHDLDMADIKLCESVLGGVLRGIEFIYKESGIDKPLTVDDVEKKNLNNTKYRIQIIKVTHAIREIILGMKNEPVQVVKENDQLKKSLAEAREDEIGLDLKKPAKPGKRILIPTLTLVTLIIFGILAYPKIFNRDTLERLRSSGGKISIAVMPFRNMTGDTTIKSWQEMFQFSLSSSLSGSEKLIIRQIESIDYLIKEKGFTDYASFTPIAARSISKKLNADVFIHGGILKAGSSIQLDAQLIDSRTGVILKSFPLKINEAPIKVIDSLAMRIREFLVLSDLTKTNLPDQQLSLVSTFSSEAYRNYFYGKNAFAIHDWKSAIEYLQEAVNDDADFTFAIMLLSWAYLNQGNYELAKAYHLLAFEKKDIVPVNLRTKLLFQHAEYFEGPTEEIKYLKQLQDYDDQDPFNYSDLGAVYNKMGKYNDAIREYNEALAIYKKWDSKPFWINQYTGLALAYHKTGQYKKEEKLYKKASKDFPDNPLLIQRQTILALTRGKNNDADEYIEKYKSLNLNKETSAFEVEIATNLAGIYSEANILDKAEEYYLYAFSLEPKNSWRMNTLAYFLIDKERDVNKGLELADTLLKLYPDNYAYLHTKGWALYKQGKYQEAMDILQKSWDLRREKAIYSHAAYLHLEAAKKAVASQKNN
jgi:tetratricopeptide (TPR) repeat protein